MADVITGITEISATSMESISNVAQTYLQQKSILMPTVTDYSPLVIAGADSVSIPRGSGFTVASKSENTAAESAAITYAKDTISLVNHRYIQFFIEDIASMQAKIAIVQENLLRATSDLARDVDQYIVAELKKASASAPDHQIVFADTGSDVIARADILSARKLLQTQFIDPRECFIGIGPEKENELLNISDFIDASKYGANDPIMNGEIGKIYGMKVIVHTDFEDFMCTWHKSAVGIAFQRKMNFGSQRELAHLATRYSLDMLHGVEVLDGGKRTVLTDSTN